MQAIDTLMNEHRLIERALDALVAFSDEAQRGGAADRAELGRFVQFIREFADAHHHGKEEDVLFAAMVEGGFPRQGGPVAVMLMEHDRGRAFTRELAALAQGEGRWSEEERERLAIAAEGYAQLLAAHIHKEDAILYPMAETRLDPSLLDRVEEGCAAKEARAESSGELTRLHALAEGLLARHAPTRPAARVHAGGCC